MLIVFIILAITIAGIITLKQESEKEQKNIEIAENNINDILRQERINIDKEIVFTQPSKSVLDDKIYTKFIVDDKNKKFGIANHKHSEKCETELLIFDYKDLLNFKINEDGEQFSPGRGMRAAGGLRYLV